MKRLLLLGSLMLCKAAFAWQVAPPAQAIEESGTSWGWWILGLVLALGMGILVYTFIKKDPKQDAR